jgi:Sulfotransferase domain
MKPNFLVIGAMKCATARLCDVFAPHPQMFVCTPKEPEFFCDDAVFARGWGWYESLFAGARGKIAVGEGSTSYTKQMRFPHAAERIAKYLPEAKLIYIARHPLKRIESHWLLRTAAGLDASPFPEALRKWPHIVDTSLYWKQISRYRDFYPDENLLLLFFEDFVSNPHDIIKRAYRFLGVNPELATADSAQPKHVRANVRVDGMLIRALQKVPAARAMKSLAPGLARKVTTKFRKPLPKRPEWPPELRREIIQQLADDTTEFLKFCGKPSDYWKLE